MARTETTTRTLYTFAELSESAKDTARQEYGVFLWEDGSMQESCELIWTGMLEDRGWENLSDLSYSLYSQGGEPMWSGDLPAFEHEGQTYYVTVRKSPRGGSCYAWELEVEPGDGAEEPVYGTPEWTAYLDRDNAVRAAVRDLCNSLSSELLRAFYAEDEYQVADEQMIDNSEANGYEYDEAGHLA